MPPSIFGLRHDVGLFFAYFEHRHRASTRDRRGLLQAIAAVVALLHATVVALYGLPSSPPTTTSSPSSTSSSPASPSSSPTTSSTPTTAGDIGTFYPTPFGTATVVDSTSAGPSDLAYNFLLVPVYACPVLATPTCAFVHDVSPGLAILVRRLVNTD